MYSTISDTQSHHDREMDSISSSSASLDDSFLDNSVNNPNQQVDSDVVTSPSSVSMCDCDLDNYRDGQYSDGEVDDSILLFRDHNDADKTSEKSKNVKSVKYRDKYVDDRAGVTEETTDLDVECELSESGNDVKNELETMRKQGAIPKHFNKPLPPLPEPNTSHHEGKTVSQLSIKSRMVAQNCVEI